MSDTNTDKATVTLIPILSDNYAYILKKGDHIAIIDPGQAEPILYALDNMNAVPNMILNTHHHSDHIAGNAPIIQKYKCPLIGPESEEHRIPNMTKTVNQGDKIAFADEHIHVIETPGHTDGHICFYLPLSGILFAGDLIFAMGCGRAFEGTPEELFASIQKIKALPPETQIYCGHEYTLSNAEFCAHIAPDSEAIKIRHKEVKQYRDNNVPTIPTTLAQELKTNVFLIAKSAEEFASLRAQKDNF